MVEPVKPFACSVEDCGMTFTNEDHLHVHTKKHDMILQLGLEQAQKTAFVADQTPTPTRFIRNCEEVGLFQDLQNVNPFDEGFKRAMETKAGVLSLDNTITTAASDDLLHTPQMVFPNITYGTDSALYNSNNQRNIIISRSSSDESGVIREYETTTISKLRNEVTTTHTSRVIGEKIIRTDDVAIVRHEEMAQNVLNREAKETSVSCKNNVIQMHSNIKITQNHNNQATECRKGIPILISYSEPSKSTANVLTEDVLLTDTTKLTVPETIPKGPIMSQKSIDDVVDSFTSDNNHEKSTEKDVQLIGMLKKNFQNVIHKKNSDLEENNSNTNSNSTTQQNKSKSKRRQCKQKVIKNKKKSNGYITSFSGVEAIIELPRDKRVQLKPVEDTVSANTTLNEKKLKIKESLLERVNRKATENIPIVQNIISTIPGGTLLPVTLVKAVNTPIIVSQQTNPIQALPVQLKLPISSTNSSTHEECDIPIVVQNGVIKSIRKNITIEERKNAASKRYRTKLKLKWEQVERENKRLTELNNSLMKENTKLKEMLLNHIKTCTHCDDLRSPNNYQRCASNKSNANSEKRVAQSSPASSATETSKCVTIFID